VNRAGDSLDFWIERAIFSSMPKGKMSCLLPDEFHVMRREEKATLFIHVDESI